MTNHPRPSPRLLRAALLAAVACLGAAAALGAPILRCEDAGGSVSYVEGSCPAGSARQREVESGPPLRLERGGEAGGVPGGGVVQRWPAVRATATAEQATEQAAEQLHLSVARCDDLVRRIEYAQQDLAAADSGGRASIELALRRLQAEHQQACATPRAAR